MSNLGDEILSKITDSKDLLTKIGSKIPGFSGYIDRQERRNSDKLLRDTISERTEEQWHRVSDLQTELIGSGDIMYVDDLEKAALKMRTFADRIKTAARGYSGIFDAVKINEEELTKILAYDNAMLDSMDGLSNAVDHVQASLGTDGIQAAIRNLATVAQQLIDAFNKRDEIVLTE